MFDKLQFVAGFHHSSTAESPDKLKFVGHFWIRLADPARRPEISIGRGYSSKANKFHGWN
jgi:hypothetical protein